MAVKKDTYNQAIEKLKIIVQSIEKDELDIDQLEGKLKEAEKLIIFCKDKLYKADKEIEKILINLDDI